MYSSFVKPFFDRLCALLALLISSPILLVVMLLLALFQKGNVFFVQERPGKGEKIFRLIKFKTMTDQKDREGQLLPDADRLTWIGQLVRKTSLDELPQLINILKGEMSFIGPRPLLVEYLERYDQLQKRRHEVVPGISGWAQVNGRNQVSWEDKFALDVWYVDHQSFGLDLKILFLTILQVLRAKGISGEGSVTMEKFQGNRPS